MCICVVHDCVLVYVLAALPPPLPPQVSHILNVAFGVENVFPDLFIYKTVSILDHPDADVLLHLPDACSFIQQAHSEVTQHIISIHSSFIHSPQNYSHVTLL